MKKTFLSGIKPSGEIHIGNYFGATKQWVNMQRDYDAYIMVADLHAITEPQDPETLRRHTLETVASLIAMGIDPDTSTLFVQSHVPEHAELMWIFSTITAMGDLERMVVYKEKREEGKEATAGLFMYPVLQSADILIYKADTVPVGKDQIQHVELTRETARRFNTRFGELFPLTEPHVLTDRSKILSLQDPSKKMSKSHGSNTYIGLFDEPDNIRKKIQSAVTDSGSDIVSNPQMRPGLANLIAIYSLCTGKDTATIEAEFSGKGYKEFKEALGDTLVSYLAPLREKQTELLSDPTTLHSILEKGTEKARTVAGKTLREVYDKVGLI
ncbi:MAG: tryptophan--tRNA ligase [Candidatus Ryanbacteria bacterium CG10_big_fil_rev_8_21_14_0_10_43_42]|uniref:Tryptophan--tRNA ligase n=1 Tax=Candidatus Ryanbacteria bacterium CG10_big_fil_rev_8_21_14_0_10_43_42 TaxID=1974864 RepID=A0A2M8KWR5_9BACT|nr:MAG: tryptophan--tRNA ligase [Candidatus Ryanbacteria bacterium CG10_big_fil_rev_8_21_14_0_10_43_42]